MLPVFLDLTDRLTLIVGGGPVGQRKARAIRAAGGPVRLVCLEPRPADWDDPALDWRQEPFAPSHLDGVGLVIAAATPEINAHVAALARSRGLWVNVAAGDAPGDLQLASVIRRGDLLVAIGTHGTAPALARRLREHLEEMLPPELSDWLTLLAELRPQIQATLPDESQRRALLAQLTAWPWLDRIRSEGIDAVRAAMSAELARAWDAGKRT